MNKLREIKCFIAVAELGNFVKAADALGVSKAAISRTILELESRLGTRLMQRTTRRLSLTEPGAWYLERCKQIVAALEDADQMLSAGNADPTGLLRINAPQSFGVLHLSSVWPSLLQRYPGIKLDVTLSDRITDIIDEGYDLAIRIARLPNSSLVYRKLASTRILVCAAPAYLQQHGVPRHPNDLQAHNVIGYSYAPDKDEWHFNGPDGALSIKTQARMRVNNGDTCVAAALAGIGIIRQPTFMVHAHIRSGKLTALMPEFNVSELGIYAVYPSRTHLPAKVRATIDFLVHAFAEANWNDC